MKQSPYFLGCPVWASPRWQGTLFTRHAKRDEWLYQYSLVFSTVEGNSTFYALPPQDTVRRWAASTVAPFRFVLKFPRSISHEHRLIDAEAETEAFLERLQILHEADRLGPSFLQLPPGFSPYQLEDLADYLLQLPREYPYAVEVRHRAFFDEGKNEEALNELLAKLHIDRVILDTRPLFSGPPSDEAEQQSQSRKPQLPVRQTVTGTHPVIRLVGRDEVNRVLPWIREWAPVIASWIIDGLTPFVFAHTPDDFYAPQLARMFHEELGKHTHRIKEMATWPGETSGAEKKQRALF
jgi:uncharacterized protein YecE (DUF72 family)